MSSEGSQIATSPPPSARVDLITAAVFLAFGLGVVGESIAMPTFTDVGGALYTAPGVVPGFLGVIIAILGFSLAVRSLLRGALRGDGGKAPGFENAPATSLTRLAIAAVLCVGFSVGMIGRMPFWLAVSIFVSLFIVIFEWQPGAAPRRRALNIASAVIIGLATGFGVLVVFQDVFLVRLP